MYLIFMCPRCGSIRYAREGQKTAGCFECGYQISLEPTKVRILAKAKRSKEAIAAVQELKMRQGKKDFK
jgi:DNA-directed RNA polymerase subunit M/transcription elongation factor TFIIS